MLRFICFEFMNLVEKQKNKMKNFGSYTNRLKHDSILYCSKLSDIFLILKVWSWFYNGTASQNFFSVLCWEWKLLCVESGNSLLYRATVYPSWSAGTWYKLHNPRLRADGVKVDIDPPIFKWAFMKTDRNWARMNSNCITLS